MRILVAPRLFAALGSVSLALAVSGQPSDAGDARDREDSGPSFTREVRPILVDNCFVCHGPDEQRADLRLDTRAGLFAELGDVAVVVPCDPEASELMYRVTADDGERMPPEKHAARLSAEEVGTLERWIEAGAAWDDHWAFASLREVDVPPLRGEPAANPIDAFIRARLASEGFEPAPPADRRTLARRLSFDLVGLPPEPAQIDAFLGDESAGAVERYVDALLASPHFGEHWGRHWLDLARYADSHGFTIDGGRSMWPYRDWVVAATNDDLAFDRFTIEQLAGDLLPEPTRAQRIATGFHRNTQINQEGGAKDEENRVHAVVDRVNTTAAVWLGVTMECAQCHDHKFDPITQRDYYRMFAFFDQTEDGGVRGGPSIQVPRDTDEEQRLAEYEARERILEAELARAEERSRAGWHTWRPTVFSAENGAEIVLEQDGSLVSVGQNPETSVYDLRGPFPRGPAGGLSALRIEALPDLGLPGHGPGRAGSGAFVLSDVVLSARAAGSGTWIPVPFAPSSGVRASHEEASDAGVGPAGGAFDGDDTTGWSTAGRSGEPHAVTVAITGVATEELDELRVELRQVHGGQRVLGRFRVLFATDEQRELGVDPGDTWRAAWHAVVEHAGERPDLPSTLVLRERRVPRETRLHRRGSFLDPGPVVTPGPPVVLDGFAYEAAQNRLGLARWLTHADNAIAQRVTVNRVWQRLFGRGLVPTGSDFGARGALPSHPDLLDWLARGFVQDGFSRKRLIQRIVTSSTYQQSSRPRPELSERDPGNELLARQARLRLPAEAIRDAALVASGLLVREIGGPPVQPPQPEGVFAFTQSKKSWTPSEGAGRYRRTLYTRLWRSSPFPFLDTFDFPTASLVCTERRRSQTPLQALTLANDPMLLELARGIGARVQREASGDGARVERAFVLTLGRPATERERVVLEAHARSERAAGRGEDAVWASVARVLMNLEEFSTRE